MFCQFYRIYGGRWYNFPRNVINDENNSVSGEFENLLKMPALYQAIWKMVFSVFGYLSIPYTFLNMFEKGP